ncbi:MAG: hypothetical protein AAGI48_14840 [Verrucomicrobiota bacterium]
MKIVFPLTTALLAGWIVSCAPQSEVAPPTPPNDVAQNAASEAEGAVDEAANEAEQAASDAEAMKEKEQEQITETIEDPSPPAAGGGTKPAVPVARRVPGRDGFVFSPFNNKMINVKGFASGTMVADPTYPASEKKYFRVP